MILNICYYDRDNDRLRISYIDKLPCEDLYELEDEATFEVCGYTLKGECYLVTHDFIGNNKVELTYEFRVKQCS